MVSLNYCFKLLKYDLFIFLCFGVSLLCHQFEMLCFDKHVSIYITFNNILKLNDSHIQFIFLSRIVQNQETIDIVVYQLGLA